MKRDTLQISPLTLGTAQLGMPYGVANKSGQPDPEESFSILRVALESGVTTLDTSRHYGNSEEVIGSYLGQYAGPRPLIVTKFSWSRDALSDKSAARSEARALARKSLTALGTDQLPIVLYHKGKDQSMDLVMKYLPEVLQELIDEGLVLHGGISLYYPEEADYVYDIEQFSVLQVPLNIFDQRLVHRQTMLRFFQSGKTVFVRSVFLQGLFFMDPEAVPHGLQEAVRYIQQLRRFAEMAEMEVAQFAVSYVRDIAGVNSIIFGADTAAQVSQNIQLIQAGRIPEYIRAQVRDFFREVPQKIITPGLW